MAASVVIARCLSRSSLTLPQCRKLVGLRVVVVRRAACNQAVYRILIQLQTLRLEIRRMRSADIWSFIPIQTEPSQRFLGVINGALIVPLAVRVFYAEDELPTCIAR